MSEEFENKMKGFGFISVDSNNAPALNVQVLREIIAGIMQPEHGQHFIVKCTEEQRKQLAVSIIEDAKNAGFELSEYFLGREYFEFVQWWTGITVVFEVDDYFMMRQLPVRVHSTIARDIKRTEEAHVTRIEKGHIYVRRLTQNPSQDPHNGAEYKWDGAFVVSNY